MARLNLQGMGVALITPFRSDKSIDFDALARLLEYQIKNGIDYLVVLGTTAETPALTPDERREVRDFVAATCWVLTDMFSKTYITEFYSKHISRSAWTLPL